MKKLRNIEDLESLMKDRLSNARVNPPADVWSSLSSSISAQSGGIGAQISTYFSSVSNIIKVALFAGGVGTAALLIYQANTPDNSKEDLVEIAENATPSDRAEKSNHIPSEELTQATDDQNELDNRDITDSESRNDVQESGDNTKQAGDGLSDLIIPGQGRSQTPSSGDDAHQTLRITRDNIVENLTVCSDRAIVLTSSAPADWYRNGSLVQRNTSAYSLNPLSGEPLTSLYYLTNTIKHSYNITELDLKAEMSVTEIKQGMFEFGTEANQEMNLQWYIDGELRSGNDLFTAYLEEGEHIIKLRVSKAECTAETVRKINVEEQTAGSFNVPQDIFSPDNDGINDEFIVEIDGYKLFSIIITDHKGNVVFQSTDPGIRWNGKLNNIGTDCPAGIENYAVMIVYQLKGDNEPKKYTDRISIQR